MTAMTRANVARRHGDDFQARWFWLKAVSLLDPLSPVIRAGYESGPRGFDDTWVAYDPALAPPDHEGRTILRRHMQCKWHTTAGTFGYADLAGHDFINAKRHSLLSRALAAQQTHAADGVGSRFELVTNWRVAAADPLLDLIRKEHNHIDLDRLFDQTTDQSRMGKVRKLWCDHIGLDHAGLRLLARTLGIMETPESLESLRERLDERFATVGLKRIPAGETGFPYDDIIFKLAAQDRIEFDRASFRVLCEREKLFDPSGRPEKSMTLGVRSFLHPIDNLEERCLDILDFVPLFDGRYIRNEDDWQGRILPALRTAMINAGRSADAVRLILDAHASLAFAAGSVLNVKSGKRIEIEQRMGGRRFWSAEDVPTDAVWPKFSFDEQVHDSGKSDVAVAISLTHDVSQSVHAFVSVHRPHIGRTLRCQPNGGSSQISVRCGRHAWMLAESVVREIRRLRDAGLARGRVHVFIAAPNGFTFFLGQQQKALGPVALYEWDFEGLRGRSYMPSVEID